VRSSLGIHTKEQSSATRDNPRSNSMRSGPLWEKKQKRCDKEDPADATQGDQWDHIGIDVQNRFVVSFVIGKRSKKNVEKVVGDFAERTGNIPPALMTTDDCSTYEGALERQYGETIVPEKTGKRGRPRKSYKQWPEKSVYATVNKTYGKGKVTGVEQELVHGTEADLAKALERSSSSDKINTWMLKSFIRMTLEQDMTEHCAIRENARSKEFSADRIHRNRRIHQQSIEFVRFLTGQQ
jgi:hypothetical protein